MGGIRYSVVKRPMGVGIFSYFHAGALRRGAAALVRAAFARVRVRGCAGARVRARVRARACTGVRVHTCGCGIAR